MSPLNIFPVCRRCWQIGRMRCSCWPLPLHLRVQFFIPKHSNTSASNGMSGITQQKMQRKLTHKPAQSLVSFLLVWGLIIWLFYNCGCIHVDMTLMLLHVHLELISVIPLTFNNISECIFVGLYFMLIIWIWKGVTKALRLMAYIFLHIVQML